MGTDNVRAWLKSGERGLSSECIAETLTGWPICTSRDEAFHPHDPSDLMRCRKLLEACPELVLSFRAKMPKVSPQWAALVAHWDELCALMDEEAPAWRAGRGNARKTYDRMHELTETPR